MENYDSLVKALRCCGNVNTDCTVCPWDKYNFGLCAEKLYTDAAAAIEALEAKVNLLREELSIWESTSSRHAECGEMMEVQE